MISKQPRSGFKAATRSAGEGQPSAVGGSSFPHRVSTWGFKIASGTAGVCQPSDPQLVQLADFRAIQRAGPWANCFWACAFGIVLTLLSGTLRAAPPWVGRIEVGDPVRLEVFPPQIVLRGPRDAVQLVVTGHYRDGALRDLTHAARYIVEDPAVVQVRDGSVEPLSDGTTHIQLRAGSLAARVPVEVRDAGSQPPVSFHYETLAALTKQGCNGGACHGAPSGKGGFRLSLAAYDPQLDEHSLIREAFGRRTNPLDPDASLILLKPLMKLPHGGGRRLYRTDPAYTILRQWIVQGCPVDAADAPQCVRLEVYPHEERVLAEPARVQQLSVRAHFSDGSVRDVTRLCVFTVSDDRVARVTPQGLVLGQDRGEVAVLVRYLQFVETVFLTFVRPVDGFVWPDPPAANYIDQLVYAKLRQLNFAPSPVCSDEVFLRRVYLDVIGILPTEDETRRFLSDPSPDKRKRLIDQLLERPEFARFWAQKWGDLLRVTKSQMGDGGVYKFHRWLERAIASNMPYDEMVRQLITASGSTLHNPAANFYRTAPDVSECVEVVAQLFLGTRLQCAKCHNHPFERWTQDNYYGLAAFFNHVQRKPSGRDDEWLVWPGERVPVVQPRTGRTMQPWVPFDGVLAIPDPVEPRQRLAEWLTSPDNPLFARVGVNRLWSQLFGRGIVDPPDDFRDSNPPSNVELLDALARDFVEHGFDRKHMLRTILNSRTYQASSQTTPLNEDDEKYFSHYYPRMLTAEQLLDAICHVTGVPERFGRMPAGTRATQLPTPELADSDFMKVFGQPSRLTVCACERSKTSNLGQALQLYNGPLIHAKLKDPNNRLRQWLQAGKSDREIIESLYLLALCRQPKPAELRTALQHVGSSSDRLRALEDICWAVLNMDEFVFQH